MQFNYWHVLIMVKVGKEGEKHPCKAAVGGQGDDDGDGDDDYGDGDDDDDDGDDDLFECDTCINSLSWIRERLWIRPHR